MSLAKTLQNARESAFRGEAMENRGTALGLISLLLIAIILIVGTQFRTEIRLSTGDTKVDGIVTSSATVLAKVDGIVTDLNTLRNNSTTVNTKVDRILTDLNTVNASVRAIVTDLITLRDNSTTVNTNVDRILTDLTSVNAQIANISTQKR